VGTSGGLIVCPIPRINVGNVHGATIIPSVTRGGTNYSLPTWAYAADYYGNIVSSYYFAIPALSAGQTYAVGLPLTSSVSGGSYSVVQILYPNDSTNEFQLSE
jgi:hypothetical protein